MSNYSSCPHCGREAAKGISSNYFPVYKCRECGRIFCKACGGSSCPKCGSSNRTEVGKVYSR